MRFRFGSELPNLIFEPTSSATLARVEVAARAALRDFEKRIVVREAGAEQDPTSRRRRADHLLRHSAYQPPGNLVFPFYLQGG